MRLFSKWILAQSCREKTWEGSGYHHRWGTSIIMQMNLPTMPHNCRINLSESKEMHCSNIPWHVYILPINNPRKDCRHVFADSLVFGLEIQKINNDEARCQETTADRWTHLHLKCEGREEMKKQISGTARLIRTEDRSGFRTTAVSLPRTAADACENQSSLDAWTPPDLEHTP